MHHTVRPHRSRGELILRKPARISAPASPHEERRQPALEGRLPGRVRMRRKQAAVAAEQFIERAVARAARHNSPGIAANGTAAVAAARRFVGLTRQEPTPRASVSPRGVVVQGASATPLPRRQSDSQAR